jgi:hypothetical protein
VTEEKLCTMALTDQDLKNLLKRKIFPIALRSVTKNIPNNLRLIFLNKPSTFIQKCKLK